MKPDQEVTIRRWLCVLGVLAAISATATQGWEYDFTASQLEDGGDRSLRDCGTVTAPEEIELAQYLESIGAHDLAIGPRYVLNVPLAVHIVRRSNGADGISPADVTATIGTANGHWAEAGIQFFQSGPPRFIDNDDFYLNIDTQAEIDQLKQTDVVANMVNTYFTENLAVAGTTPGDPPNPLCGQASFTWTAVQGLVMANACTPAGGNSTSFAHELGHYFNMLHTHDMQIWGPECPDGSNCDRAGDLLCDTPADPDLSGNVNTNGCGYTGAATRCDQPFSPDPTNLMSYAPRQCRNHFTYGQRNVAVATLVNQRANLTGGALNLTWVDFSWGFNEEGSFNAPYNDLPSAISATAQGGRIVMKAGTIGAMTLDEPRVFDSFRGPAVIGQ